MNEQMAWVTDGPLVRVVAEPATNLQGSARACCASCHDDQDCTAFQWCAGVAQGLLQHSCGVPAAAACRRRPLCPPRRDSSARRCPLPGGCTRTGGNGSFPYQGCQLIDLSAFLTQSVNTGQIKRTGADVPFTAGAPLPMLRAHACLLPPPAPAPACCCCCCTMPPPPGCARLPAA